MMGKGREITRDEGSSRIVKVAWWWCCVAVEEDRGGGGDRGGQPVGRAIWRADPGSRYLPCGWPTTGPKHEHLLLAAVKQ